MRKIFSTLVIVLLLFFVFTPSFAMGQLFFFGNSLEGKPAPDFTLSTTSGQKLNMTAVREGKSAIIFFWATWCPHCRSALNELNQKEKDIQQQGIKLMVVDLGESSKVVSAYQKKYNITIDMFLDTDSALGETYNIIGVPTFFLVDAKGIVRSVGHALPDDYARFLK
ncbi:MAG: TlpA disulfide reductase family protein [Candidatus Omnitrophota bacterium]